MGSLHKDYIEKLYYQKMPGFSANEKQVGPSKEILKKQLKIKTTKTNNRQIFTLTIPYMKEVGNFKVRISKKPSPII